MSRSAEIISFPVPSLSTVDERLFFPDDEELIINILAVLCTEMTHADMEYEARVRLYFYLGLNRYALQRWSDSLATTNSAESRELGEQLNEMVQHLTSKSMIEDNAEDGRSYFSKLGRLSSSLFSLLRLIHSYHGAK
jgi:hypothetical protein